jgi:hypothetical protein
MTVKNFTVYFFIFCLSYSNSHSAYSNEVFLGAFNKINWFKSFNEIPPRWIDGKERGARIFNNEINEYVLEVQYPRGGVGPVTTGIQWRSQFMKRYQKLKVKYSVKFSDQFDFVKGGKLPGLIGGRIKGSSGNPKTPDGTDGWSGRIMWRKNGAVVQYVYHMHKTVKWGEDFKWEIKGTDVHFIPGKWHQIETEITMNDLGKRNGRIKSWFDGVLALDKGKFEFRTIKKLGIDALYFSTFFGGNDFTWAPSKNESIQFSKITITN